MAFSKGKFVAGNPDTSAIQSFHIRHKQAGKVNLTRSRSIDRDDTTRVWYWYSQD
ncbi:MAG TPA: hypothetical protein VK909_00395 [Anaerolineales bacterium]|nr:hypothetical protein [Anaerolineales bacterium]